MSRCERTGLGEWLRKEADSGWRIADRSERATARLYLRPPACCTGTVRMARSAWMRESGPSLQPFHRFARRAQRDGELARSTPAARFPIRHPRSAIRFLLK